MATVVNSAGNANARARISAGDTIDAPWSFDAADGNALLGTNGDNWDEFGRWHLGIDTTATPKTKGYYDYPFGKGGKLYVSAIRAIRSRSAQEGDAAVFAAAGRLMDEINTPGKDFKAKVAAGTVDARRVITAMKQNWLDEDNPPEKQRPTDVIRKITVQRTAPTPGADFVMSDETKDRYGEVIVAKGWQLANFKRNPIMLFNHNPDMPIGQWDNVRVEGTQLLGKPRFIPAVSDRTREIQAAYDAGVLRAASVGFLGEREPMDGGGYKYPKPDLVECSIVSTPANPNALQVVKSLVSSGKIGAETARLICGEHAETDQSRPRPRQISGEHAERKTGVSANTRATLQTKANSMNLSQKIERSQDKINSYRAAMDAEAEKVDGDDEESREAYTRLNAELTRKLDSELAFLAGLKATEERLGETSEEVEPVARSTGTAVVKAPHVARPFAKQQKEVNGFDLLVRAVTVHGIAAFGPGDKSIDRVLDERYPGHEATALITKADPTLGVTGTAGYALELVQSTWAGFLEALTGVSIYPVLRDRGIGLSFNGNGTVNIASRTAGGAGGGFFAEGSPMRVGNVVTATLPMTARQMGVIITFSRKLAMQSTPSIESVVRQAIVEDTATLLDPILLDATASSTARPAGLLYGVSAAASGYGGADYRAVQEDFKALLQPFITANGADNITVVMNSAQGLSLALMDGPVGNPGWFNAISNRVNIVESTHATANRLIAIRNSDLATATGDAPQFEVSTQAVLHMEDTSPAAIAAGSSYATPVRSLWQTDSIGVRMVMDISWLMRRSGMVQWISSTSW